MNTVALQAVLAVGLQTVAAAEVAGIAAPSARAPRCLLLVLLLRLEPLPVLSQRGNACVVVILMLGDPGGA